MYGGVDLKVPPQSLLIRVRRLYFNEAWHDRKGAGCGDGVTHPQALEVPLRKRDFSLFDVPL